LRERKRYNREEAGRLKADFGAFIHASWHIVDPAMPLIDNWHIDALAEHLQAIGDRQIRFLMINIGPGYAKSVIGSVMFSAWMWARNPQRKILAATYAKSLSIRDSIRTKESDFVNVVSGRVQPRLGTVARKENTSRERQYNAQTGTWDWVKTNEDWLSNNQKGERRALTVRGAATGFRADGQIMDDLLNASERNSKAIRDDATEWAIKTMSSRFKARRHERHQQDQKIPSSNHSIRM
jgi:hypothetical protein